LESDPVKIAMRAAAGGLLVAAAILGWREFSSGPVATADSADADRAAAPGHPAARTRPTVDQASRRNRPTSGRLAGPDSVVRYFRSDDEQRHRILEEWTERAETAPEDLVARLAELHPKETNPELKEAIVDALAWVGSGESFDALLGLHQGESDPDQREIVAMALEGVISDLAADGETVDWERIARGWGEGLPKDVRLSAIQAVMEGGDRAMIPRLQALAKDGDAEVREAAGQAIEWLEDP
jgi:HEAT repeat protein